MAFTPPDGIIRVFPRRTNATPDDPLTWIGEPGLLRPVGIDEVRVSVTFSWDMAAAERIAASWADLGYRVRMGGPAAGDPGGEFEPGMYLKPGYVVTSRGCPNRCWFCDVPRREGPVRELPVRDGLNVIDSNLLACSEAHVSAVLRMLGRQRGRPQLTGGLDPRLMTPDVMEAIRTVRPKQVFTAYDTPDDADALPAALEACWKAGFTRESHAVRCFVLAGWPGDTVPRALARLEWVASLGAIPMAMVYRPPSGAVPGPEWRRLQKYWARPAFVAAAAGNGRIG